MRAGAATRTQRDCDGPTYQLANTQEARASMTAG